MANFYNLYFLFYICQLNRKTLRLSHLEGAYHCKKIKRLAKWKEGKHMFLSKYYILSWEENINEAISSILGGGETINLIT